MCSGLIAMIKEPSGLSFARALAIMKKLVSEGMAMVIITHKTGFAREAENKVIFGNPKSERTRVFPGSVL